MSSYDFFKDFASSIATIVAAFIAAAITFTFASKQAQIATSQRDIALDKLKFDLFDKRYGIYQAAKELIEIVSFVADTESQGKQISKIRSLYVTLDEGRFYFLSNIRAVLDEIHKLCEQFFQHLAERENINIASDDHRQKWSQMADLLACDQALRKIYASLPEKFEPALAFKQLTSSIKIGA